jgi:hypothetical protein
MSARQYILFLILFPFVCLLHFKNFGYIFDDAYIHFRIAENLVEYGSPYFNLEEKYMSSSSSAWTIFLGIIYWLIGEEYLLVLPFINSILLVFNIFLYKNVIELHLKNKFTLPQELFFSISFIALTLNSSAGLMESQFALFFVGLAVFLFSKEKIIGFVFLTIAIFFRLEIVLFYFLFFTYFIFYKKQNFVLIIFYSFFALLPFFIYNLYFFYTLIPFTVHAKSLVYDLSFLSVIYGVIPSAYGFKGKLFELICASLFMYYIYENHTNKSRVKLFNTLTVFFLSGVILLFAYIGKKTFVHEWYQPLYLIPIFTGIVAISFKLNNVRIYLLLVLLILPFYKDLSKHSYAAMMGDNQHFPGFKSGARVKQYLDISNALYKKYPNAILMSSEIGGLGYGFKGKIIDGMGLIQPACLKYHPMRIPEERSSGGIGAIPSDCVKEKLPELIVSYDVFIQSLSKSSILNKYNHYQLPVFKEEDLKLAKTKSIWGSKYLNVYIRNDIDKGL